MLDIRCELKGSQMAISGLGKFGRGAREAARRGLSRIVKEAHREAFGLLSGPGRKKVRSRDYTRGGRKFRKTRKRGQSDMLGGRPGSYPVPVITGNLRQRLDFVEPGQSRTADGLTFTAGDLEAVLFDSAEYSEVIHEGKGTSERYGPRPFIVDGADRVNAVGILEDEVRREMP